MGLGSLRLAIAAWLWGVKIVLTLPKRSVPFAPTEEPQMDKASPLGLTEAEENNFRVLLTKIREHDKDFLNLLMVECLGMVQPPETIKAYHRFDDDGILTSLVLAAKGTKTSANLSRLLSDAGEES